MFLNRIGLIATPVPDWRRAVEVQYAFRTSIITSRDGTEQREAMRQTARVTIQHQSTLTEKGMHRHLADVAAAMDQLFTVPARWRKVRVESYASGAASVSEVPPWAVAGQHVVFSDGVTEEVSKITGVAAGSITAATTLTQPTLLYYAYQARMDDRVRFTAQTDNLWTGRVDWAVDPGSDRQAAPAISPEQFEGTDLFLTRPNWRRRPRFEFNSDRETLDNDRGVISVRNPVAYPHEDVQFGFTQFRQQQVDDLVAFFLRHRGRRGQFYAPTWRSDMRAPDGATAGATTLEVNSADLGAFMSDSLVYRVIYLHEQAVRVTDVAPGPLGATLTLADPLALDVTPKTMISWCPLWRFGADRMEVRWLTDEVAEVTAPLRSLRDTGGA